MGKKFTELFENVYYYVVWFLFKVFLYSFFKIEIIKLSQYPLPKSCIIVANHRSILDTALLFILFKEKLKFISTPEVMNYPFWGKLLKPFDCIIVSRDGFDRPAIKNAMCFLVDGGRLILFPEGGIRPKPYVSFTTGAAFLSIKANVPVIPVGIQNSLPALKDFQKRKFKSKVKAIIGETIYPEGDHKLFSQKMQDTLAELEAWDDTVSLEVQSKC
jgi:1-acyl-sn-glycerol-3-phosphate acyltransferase